MKQRTLLQKLIILFVTICLLSSGLGHLWQNHRRHQGSLAIVKISGPIKSSLSASDLSGSDADEIAKELHKLSEDEDVKAIVLRINSPGGTVGSVQEINEEITRCQAKGKKIVASLGDVAASGGYYLASTSDRIISNPGTITGSIGVILEFGNLEGLLQKLGVKLQVVKSGAHKDIGSPARPLTEEEKNMLQVSINDAYAQFFKTVQDGRHLSTEKLKAIADGRIFTGRQALQAGLVDEMGDQEDAIQVAIRLAKLPAKPVIISEDHTSWASVFQRLTTQLFHPALDSLQNAILGTTLEYRWRLS